MATESDVENALVGLVASALYPAGPGSESVTGALFRIYRGWPTSASLDNDLSVGISNVTVFPNAEPGCNTTRYIQQPRGTVARPSLVAVTHDTSISFEGTPNAHQLVGVLIDGIGYVYQSLDGDTPDVLAAKLAALIRKDRIVTSSGPTVTVPGAGSVSARVVAETAIAQEIRRQEQGFRITFWCPTPDLRDVSAAAVDACLAGYQFLEFDDGSRGRMRYRGVLTFDQSQDALLYRRDLIYDVEYPTIVTALQPTMLFGHLRLNSTMLTV